MKKLLTLVVMAVLAVTANAYDFTVDGIAYSSNGNSAEVVKINESLLSQHSSFIIPETVTYTDGSVYPVTEIGNGAFYGCTGLTSVTIPSSVTKIGSWAFKGCTGLTSVTIPRSAVIETDAFPNWITMNYVGTSKASSNASSNASSKYTVGFNTPLEKAQITQGMKLSDIQYVRNYYFNDYGQIRRGINRDKMPDYTPNFIHRVRTINATTIYDVAFFYRGNNYNHPVVRIWVRNGVVTNVVY